MSIDRDSSSSPPPAACRFCRSQLQTVFVDLGMSPFCNTLIEPRKLNQMEPFFPLHVWVCDSCLLVQLEEYVAPDHIFSEYSYFSSYSDTWVEHARRYTDLMRERFGIGRTSLVVEIASNDGYLLQHFVAADVPVLGVEPAANVAQVAIQKGIRTEVCFHGRKNAASLVERYGQADLVLGNNVLAHVPDINDFVAGLKIFLKPGGVVTMEFPHLQRLMQHNQFDTIYHEHFSYLSLLATRRIFDAHGLVIFDVEELATHGGSVRIYARHKEDAAKPITARSTALFDEEQRAGLDRIETYRAFGEQVRVTKRKILAFLIDLKDRGKQIVGYGAPGKGNTLLNYCAIGPDILDYTVDRNPYKQGNHTPGMHIPIYSPDKIRQTRPDYVLILPWNLKDEIVSQLADVRSWGCKFITLIPTPSIID